MSNKTNRSNAYQAGYSSSGSLADNPYRKGIKEWHQWRKGLLDGAKDFSDRLMNYSNHPAPKQ